MYKKQGYQPKKQCTTNPPNVGTSVQKGSYNRILIIKLLKGE